MFLTDVILNNPGKCRSSEYKQKVDTHIGTFLCLVEWLQFHKALTKTQKKKTGRLLFVFVAVAVFNQL